MDNEDGGAAAPAHRGGGRMIEARETAVDRPGRPAETSPAIHGSIRWLAVAAGLGGTLWIMMAAWDATNPGESDLGLMPSSIRWFLIVPSLVLVMGGLIGLGRLNGRKGRPWVVTGLVGTGLALGRVGFDIWQLYIGLVGLMIASFALAVQAFRTRTMPRWAALLLAAGMVIMPLGSDQGGGPWLWAAFGVGWIAAGYGLWAAAPKATLVPAART
jgi:hypothetical protein